jgi:hypothetical protein
MNREARMNIREFATVLTAVMRHNMSHECWPMAIRIAVMRAGHRVSELMQQVPRRTELGQADREP